MPHQAELAMAVSAVIFHNFLSKWHLNRKQMLAANVAFYQKLLVLRCLNLLIPKLEDLDSSYDGTSIAKT
jgi:hypothetical protein